jgi:hypothetical protein
MDGNKSGRVLFDFTGQAENQISLKKGQILSIISVGQKGGWSKGKEVDTGTSRMKRFAFYFVGIC